MSPSATPCPRPLFRTPRALGGRVASDYAARVSKKIVIDCDPGIDDALAITLAHGHPDVEIVGLTTVGGNVELAKTTANALRLRELLGFPEVPVVAGSAEALLRSRVHAAGIHGDGGLGGATLPEPELPPHGGHAVDFIIDTLRAAPSEITIAAIGPLTNIALAVRREPRVVEWVRELVIMGGSYTRGRRRHLPRHPALLGPPSHHLRAGVRRRLTRRPAFAQTYPRGYIGTT